MTWLRVAEDSDELRETLADALRWFAAVFVVGCAGSSPVRATASQTSPAIAGSLTSVASSPPAAEASQEAHRLVISAAGCWSSGIWSEALGEEDLTRQRAIEVRCRDLERRVWVGAQESHYDQLCALQASAVAEVVAKVDETATNDRVDDTTRGALVRLASALAEAERELMLARRAAGRVTGDLDHEPEKLNADEVAAVAPLRAHAKLDELLKLDSGALSKEAHALGLLVALDRVEFARSLPKHLRPYAVADELQSIFGVTPPDLPQDANGKLVAGTWLRFLSETAAAAGYPVDDNATTSRERDALAWAGMLQGFSDKLKADADPISSSTDLGRVVTVTFHRLEADYKAQKVAEAMLHSSGARRR
jgi:hypothetical protein